MKSGGQTKSPLGLCPLVVRESRNGQSINFHCIKNPRSKIRTGILWQRKNLPFGKRRFFFGTFHPSRVKLDRLVLILPFSDKAAVAAQKAAALGRITRQGFPCLFHGAQIFQQVQQTNGTAHVGQFAFVGQHLQ